jgi:hypothetical protein
MKLGNNINKGIKEAFSGHTVPLRDAQWERIQKELNAPSKKKPFIFWPFILIGVLVSAGILIQYVNRDAKIAVDEQLAQVDVSKLEITEPQIQNRSEEENTDSTLKENEVQKTESNESSNTVANDAKQSRSNHKSPINKKSKKENQIEKYSEPHSIINSEVIEAKSETTLGQGSIGIVQMVKQEESLTQIGPEQVYEAANLKYKWPLSELSTLPLMVSEVEKVKAPLPIDSSFYKVKEKPRRKNLFALGFATGVSTVSTKIEGISNEQKLHKDTRNLFEQSTQNQQTQFLNLTFDYLFFARFGIGLSTGLQYRSISSAVDISYRLNQIPLRMPNGDILTYYTAPDSMSPLIKVNNKTALRYINIPIKLTYTFNIKRIHEIQLSGGTNFAILAGSKGNTFSLNDASTQPVGNMISNLFNAGYTGGIQYSRPIMRKAPLDHWYLGCAFQYQKNRQDYNMDYGILRSNVLAYNIAFNLRYKF